MTRNEFMATVAATMLAAAAVLFVAPVKVKVDAPPRALDRQAPSVSDVLRLQDGDGKIYVLFTPDPLEISPSTCYVHVNPPAASSMTCVAGQITLAQTRP